MRGSNEFAKLLDEPWIGMDYAGMLEGLQRQPSAWPQQANPNGRMSWA